jgi:MFS family permease
MKQNEENPRSRDRFSALYVRDFRIFWIGQVISFSGTWMQSIAQGWLVYEITKSPFYLGLVAAAASLPVLLFTLIGGVVADRVPKKNLLLITQTLSMIPALLLGVLIQLKVVTVEEIVIIAFFLGLVNAFDIPGRQSFFAEMVQEGHLMNAIALNSAAFNGARIIGPVIAGITIAAVGVAACFYINAVSFLAAIVALIMIKGKPGEYRRDNGVRPKATVTVILRDLYEGLRFVKGEREIFGIMLLVAMFSLFGIPFVTFLPVFAEDVLRVGPRGLGFLAGSSGVGSLIAALLIAYLGRIEKRGNFMYAAGLIFGVSLLAFSFSRNYDLSAATLAFAGWGMVSFFAIGNSSIQLSTPDSLRGRVMSVYALFFLGFAPIGNALMGSIARVVGTDRAISIGSCLCISAILLSSRRLKTARRQSRQNA